MSRDSHRRPRRPCPRLASTDEARTATPTIRHVATTEDPRASLDGTAEWKRELYDAAPEREGEVFSTISGLENEPLYTPETVEIDYDRDLGYPGVYPFTRGVYPSMYRGKLWTMRQFAGFGTAEETNARFRYGARNPRSWLMRFHTQTAGVSLTAQQPEVNIIRTALEALAAVLGGTQSLHTNSFDEALALPTEDAVRLALRTQQVIAHETGVVNTIDPLGGSWYLEDLTNRLEAEAYDYFHRIERLGGVIEAIKDNFFQREIAEASFRYQAEVEAEQRVIVGVNRYQLEDEPDLDILRIDPALEAKQVERVQALRARRESGSVEAALTALKEAASREDVNLMPPILEASRAYVTMGEMCEALREVWGVWRETPVF